MASPGESEGGESDGQVDKNALLLHTIASYMVKENRYLLTPVWGRRFCVELSVIYACHSASVIDKSVPKAILQSLIKVTSGILHQTHNCQGFQELMLIMSTLARQGGEYPPVL